MPDPREVLAAALAEQSPDDDDLRDWLTDRAEFVADALAAAGFYLCSEGQAVVDREVVGLSEPRERTRSFGRNGATATWVWEATKTLPLGVRPGEEAPDAR